MVVVELKKKCMILIGAVLFIAAFFVLSNPRGPLIWIENPPEKPAVVLFPADLPIECAPFDGDYCALFSCLEPSCWCESEGALTEPVDDFVGVSESTAWFIVESYLEEKEPGWSYSNSVELNEAFYNVFVEDAEGNEDVYSVAKDGTVIKTVCGV